jgi:hypothetical protein
LGDGSFRVVFEHHKTRTRIQEAIRIPVAADTVTATLLHDYVQRRRPLLVKTDTRALFLNKRGDAFSEYSFGEYVPRLLNQLGLGSLSYTTVRARPPPAARPAPASLGRNEADSAHTHSCGTSPPSALRNMLGETSSRVRARSAP